MNKIVNPLIDFARSSYKSNRNRKIITKIVYDAKVNREISFMEDNYIVGKDVYSNITNLLIPCSQEEIRLHKHE